MTFTIGTQDKQSIINTIDDVCKIYNQESYLIKQWV